jgi:hypothetical protein
MFSTCTIFSTHFEKTHIWQFQVKRVNVTWTKGEYVAVVTTGF